MDEDTHRALIDDGVQFPFLGGCGVETIIIEGQEPGVVVFEGGFGPGEDHLYLFVGVKVVVVMGDGILDEAADLFDLPAVVGGFGGQGAILEFLWFGKGIVHPFLGHGGQAAAKEEGC
jgi:hypothetical protein